MSWRLALVGDIMLQRQVQSTATFSFLRDAPLAFGNLEVPFSANGYPADKPIVFRASPSLVPELNRMGLRIVSFANNHSFDYGAQAMLDTLASVRQAGIGVVGAGANLGEAMTPVVTAVDGKRIAWLAFSCTLPPGFAATSARPGVAPIRIRASFLSNGTLSEEQPGTPPYVFTEVLADDLHTAQQAIRSAREQSDAIVVSIHWGVPPGWSSAFQGPLADYQRPLARALVEAGASIILGHHPHTLHGIEIYRGCPVFYSLGNFMFHSLADRLVPYNLPAPYRLDRLRPPELRETAIFLMDFEGANRKRIEVLPCVLDASGESQFADAQQAVRILGRLEGLCAELGTHVEVRDNRAVIQESR